MGEQDTFKRALSNFMNDFAGGDAVRHLTDCGLTVPEIVHSLSYPMKKEKAAEMVWNRYLETGVICLEKPNGHTVRKVSYVQEQGEYGRISLRQVTEEVPAPKGEYLECDFGLELYRDRGAFCRKLDVLNPDDREYILELPWPLQKVWHLRNERMDRIARVLGM